MGHIVTLAPDLGARQILTSQNLTPKHTYMTQYSGLDIRIARPEENNGINTNYLCSNFVNYSQMS
jgi:hypothetical protein